MMRRQEIVRDVVRESSSSRIDSDPAHPAGSRPASNSIGWIALLPVRSWIWCRHDVPAAITSADPAPLRHLSCYHRSFGGAEPLRFGVRVLRPSRAGRLNKAPSDWLPSM